MDIEYDEAKFTEMLLYVADKLGDDRAGGATKLNKILYFAEFAHVRRHGRPISGADYFRLDQGPAPPLTSGKRNSTRTRSPGSAA